MIFVTASVNHGILDGFYFALFGDTMREISKLNFIVNRKIGKNCIVRLEADIKDINGKNVYLIERKLAPSGVKIWQNGKEITKSTAAETNKFINELFGAEKDIFQNCILMRSNNNVPFMAKKKQEKKNFIESIFNLNIFSQMGRLLKEDTREIKSKYSLEQNELNLLENNNKNYHQQLENLLNLQRQADEHKQEEIDDLHVKIQEELINRENIKNELGNILANSPSDDNEICKQLKNNNDFLNKLNNLHFKLSYELKVCKKDLEKLENSGDFCPTCNQKYPEEHFSQLNLKKEGLYKKIDDFSSQIKTVSEKIEEISLELSNCTIKRDEIQANLLKIKHLKEKIVQSERILGLYKEQLSKKQEIREINGIDEFKKLIFDAEESISKVKNSIGLLEQLLEKFNICEHILSEHGIRPYIINRLLNLFNNRIMFYLTAIGSTFNFNFNEYFEEEIKDVNGIICQYANCSGAEMKKIDLAISFAINDMLSLQKQISYNIIFFDEILDSSLDDKSLNIILNFISEHTQKENKAVYIISHKSGAQIPYVNEVINLEKSNGFTKRIIN